MQPQEMMAMGRGLTRRDENPT